MEKLDDRKNRDSWDRKTPRQPFVNCTDKKKGFQFKNGQEDNGSIDSRIREKRLRVQEGRY